MSATFEKKSGWPVRRMQPVRPAYSWCLEGGTRWACSMRKATSHSEVCVRYSATKKLLASKRRLTSPWTVSRRGSSSRLEESACPIRMRMERRVTRSWASSWRRRVPRVRHASLDTARMVRSSASFQAPPSGPLSNSQPSVSPWSSKGIAVQGMEDSSQGGPTVSQGRKDKHEASQDSPSAGPTPPLAASTTSPPFRVQRMAQAGTATAASKASRTASSWALGFMTIRSCGEKAPRGTLRSFPYRPIFPWAKVPMQAFPALPPAPPRGRLKLHADPATTP